MRNSVRFKKGRTRIGISKKYNITLPEEYYYTFNEYIKNYGYSASSFLRELIIDFIDSKEMLNKRSNTFFKGRSDFNR